MSYDGCDPCCSAALQGSYGNERAWRQNIHKLLCSNSAIQSVSNIQDIAVAYGSINTSGAVGLSNVVSCRLFQVRNTTDADILVSIDGGVTYPFFLDADIGNLIVDLATNKLTFSNDIYLKALVSDPTSGSVYIGVVG